MPDATRKPQSAWLADLCCGGGLAADGYAAVFGARALDGYDVLPQPEYPYTFTEADALALLAAGPRGPLAHARALHTSFPCQFATTAAHLRTAQGGKSRWPDLLTPGLALLREKWGHLPWVCENVDDNRKVIRRIMAPRPGEHLIVLCGSMFGLEVQRHRLFLANFPLRRPAPVPDPPGKGRSVYRAQGCDHSRFPIDPGSGKPRPWGVWHVAGDSIPAGGHTAVDAEHGRRVMGSHRSLPWEVLKEGFPPAYTTWVGADLLHHLASRPRGR